MSSAELEALGQRGGAAVGEPSDRRGSPTAEQHGQRHELDQGHLRYLRSPNHQVILGGDEITFGFGTAAHTFTGRGVGDRLAPLLERLGEPASFDDLVADLDDDSRAGVVRALALLVEQGLVVEAPPEAPIDLVATAHLAMTHQHGFTPTHSTTSDVVRRLQLAHVTVVGNGVAAGETMRMCRELGLATRPATPDDAAAAPGDFVVVAPDRSSPDEVDGAESLADSLLGAAVPWTSIGPFDGELLTVGPVVIGGETACHECARRRRTAATQLGAGLHHLTGRTGVGGSAATLAVGAGLATYQALRWLATHDPRVPGRLSAYRPFAGTVSEHLVLRVPRCPVCGPVHPAPSPWTPLAGDVDR